MYQTITITMKNSEQFVWGKDAWDDYHYDGKCFIIKKNGEWIGFYNLDQVVSIVVQ